MDDLDLLLTLMNLRNIQFCKFREEFILGHTSAAKASARLYLALCKACEASRNFLNQHEMDINCAISMSMADLEKNLELEKKN